MSWGGVPLLVLSALLCASCAAIGPHPGGCPVAPVPSQALPGRMLLRSRMHLVAPTGEFRLETVAVVEGGDLVVVGIAPFGIRLFTIRQRGREHSVETEAAGPLAPPPIWVLDSLHRIHWIEPPPGHDSGERRSWEWGGERVTDWLRDGTLRRREFTRGDRGNTRRSGETVSIDYADAGKGGSSISIRNPWCGYEGRLVTLEATPGSPATAE